MTLIDDLPFVELVQFVDAFLELTGGTVSQAIEMLEEEWEVDDDGNYRRGDLIWLGDPSENDRLRDACDWDTMGWWEDFYGDPEDREDDYDDDEDHFDDGEGDDPDWDDGSNDPEDDEEDSGD